jgi:hypothetical protein
MKEYIDWTVFLGMHHRNIKMRMRCKNFFAQRLKNEKEIFMSLENVGKCDDIIWGYAQTLQEVYYPFMDVLHSTANIIRLPYELDHYKTAKVLEDNHDIAFMDRMSIAFASQGLLYTLNTFILNIGLPNVKSPIEKEEITFPKKLESLYERSLILMVDW